MHRIPAPRRPEGTTAPPPADALPAAVDLPLLERLSELLHRF